MNRIAVSFGFKTFYPGDERHARRSTSPSEIFTVREETPDDRLGQ